MSAMSMGDERRNARQLAQPMCLMCGRSLPVDSRSTYCGPTCRQRAFRLRHRQSKRLTLTHLADLLRRERQLVAQTAYECTSCSERLLGERRCGDCNLMCRKLGLGGRCTSCDEILTIADLLGTNLEGGCSSLVRE